MHQCYLPFFLLFSLVFSLFGSHGELRGMKTKNPEATKVIQNPKYNTIDLDHLGERLGAVLFKGLDKGLIWRQGAQRATHVGVHDLKAINVAGVDPAETVLSLVSTAENFSHAHREFWFGSSPFLRDTLEV